MFMIYEWYMNMVPAKTFRFQVITLRDYLIQIETQIRSFTV